MHRNALRMATLGGLLSFALALPLTGSLALVRPPVARAQDTGGTSGATAAPSAQAIADARDAFRTGTAAMQSGNWASARESFARAYSLAPNPLVLLNLAAAEMHTGLLVEAAAHYRAFAHDPGTSSDPYRADAARALGGLEPRIPSLHLEATGLADDDELLLDGSPLPRTALGTELPVDPGARHVEVRRDGHTVFETTTTVAESQTVRVTLTPAPPPVSADVSPSHVASEEGRNARARARSRAMSSGASDRDDRTVWESPWLWVVVGVVVAAGATTAIVIAASPGDPQAFPSTLPPVEVR